MLFVTTFVIDEIVVCLVHEGVFMHMAMDDVG